MGNLPWEFDEDVEFAAYRLIQESLSNAFRHGQASLVEMYLSSFPCAWRASAYRATDSASR